MISTPVANTSEHANSPIIRFDRRTVVSYSRQAPFIPLAHYTERESVLGSYRYQTVAYNGDPDLTLVSLTAIVDRGLAITVPSPLPTIPFSLIPLTELVNTDLVGTTPAALKTVSVRRGWNTRLITRLANRLTDAETVTSELTSPLLELYDVEQSTQHLKVGPTLLDFVPNAHRSPSRWAYGIPQPLRVSSLTRRLSRLAGVPVHLVRINALSLARFDFDRDVARRVRSGNASSVRETAARVRVPTSARFLARLEQERGSRFSAAAGRLPDLLRLGFVAVYLKNAGVRAQLLANSLARLPRNRNEIPFIRFMRKVVKVLVSARPERLGVRVSFKGRVAR